MNILVIGNGFDLEHNLPTTYGDFLKFIKIIKKIGEGKYNKPEELENLSQFNDKVREYLRNKDLFKSETRNKHIQEMMDLLEKNVWIEYFIKRNNYSGKGWIDFESEISDVIKSFEYYKNRNINIIKGKIEKTAPVDRDAENILLKFNVNGIIKMY